MNGEMDGNGTNQEGDEQICEEVDGETLFCSRHDCTGYTGTEMVFALTLGICHGHS